MGWREEGANAVLEPEHEWEGAWTFAIEPSARGEARRLVRQLRDPCVYEEDGKTYLLYCGGGESGIGIAESPGPRLTRRPHILAATGQGGSPR